MEAIKPSPGSWALMAPRTVDQARVVSSKSEVGAETLTMIKHVPSMYKDCYMRVRQLWPKSTSG